MWPGVRLVGYETGLVWVCCGSVQLWYAARMTATPNNPIVNADYDASIEREAVELDGSFSAPICMLAIGCSLKLILARSICRMADLVPSEGEERVSIEEKQRALNVALESLLAGMRGQLLAATREQHDALLAGARPGETALISGARQLGFNIGCALYMESAAGAAFPEEDEISDSALSWLEEVDELVYRRRIGGQSRFDLPGQGDPALTQEIDAEPR